MIHLNRNHSSKKEGNGAKHQQQRHHQHKRNNADLLHIGHLLSSFKIPQDSPFRNLLRLKKALYNLIEIGYNITIFQINYNFTFTINNCLNYFSRSNIKYSLRPKWNNRKSRARNKWSVLLLREIQEIYSIRY